MLVSVDPSQPIIPGYTPGELVLATSWDTCPCSSNHSPHVFTIQRHHVLPKSWGGTNGPLTPLCGTGHDAVHWLLNWWLRMGETKRPPHPTNSHLAEVARLGWALRLPGHPTPYTLIHGEMP